MPAATIRCPPTAAPPPPRLAMPTTFNLRLALWALLGMALFLNYQMWSHDYVDVVPPGTVGANAAPTAPLDSAVPTASLPTGTLPTGTVPATGSTPGASMANSGTAANPAASAASSASADSAHGLVAHALLADSPTAP